MTPHEAHVQAMAAALADEFRRLVLARTGLTPKTLTCPREKSEMTPCVARDGRLAVAHTFRHTPICVGCEARLELLVEGERDKARTR
jgi:hypothetical protein